MPWILIKYAVVPGSLPFLALALVAGILLRRVQPRLAWVWLVAIALLYTALSLPPVAVRLARSLDTAGPLSRFDTLPQHVAVVALGGDYEEGRVREAARLFERLDPPLFILSGDEKMHAAAVEAGIPADRITWESTSRTTREQALKVAEALRDRGVERFVLVASSIHMPRALAAFRAAGLDPIPSASSVAAGWPTSATRFFPRWSALQLSTASIYEYLALRMYRLRGWLA